jgi:hypothetical protein
MRCSGAGKASFALRSAPAEEQGRVVTSGRCCAVEGGGHALKLRLKGGAQRAPAHAQQKLQLERARARLLSTHQERLVRQCGLGTRQRV